MNKISYIEELMNGISRNPDISELHFISSAYEYRELVKMIMLAIKNKRGLHLKIAFIKFNEAEVINGNMNNIESLSIISGLDTNESAQALFKALLNSPLYNLRLLCITIPISVQLY